MNILMIMIKIEMIRNDIEHELYSKCCIMDVNEHDISIIVDRSKLSSQLQRDIYDDIYNILSEHENTIIPRNILVKILTPHKYTKPVLYGHLVKFCEYANVRGDTGIMFKKNDGVWVVSISK